MLENTPKTKISPSELSPGDIFQLRKDGRSIWICSEFDKAVCVYGKIPGKTIGIISLMRKRNIVWKLGVKNILELGASLVIEHYNFIRR